MKIIHAVYSLEMGGAEVLVAQLCRSQRAAGHDVSILAYSRLGVIGEGLKAEGFDIHIPGEAHPLKTMWRYFKLFRQRRPDVVHCHNVAPTIHAALSARLAGVRSVLSTRHRLELFPYDRKSELQYNVMCYFCDWIVGICEVTCVNVRKGPLARVARIVRVYNGCAAVERADYTSLGKTAFTFVFVGRLVREKAVHVLIEALAEARTKGHDLRLWIVGDGNVRADLEALTAKLALGDSVTFWGQQTRTAPFFSAADVFAMSSISEGLPMSLLQSMSLGTPALLTDVDGNGEILRLTGGGLLVPVGDVPAMADAMVRLAADRQLYVDVAAKALAAYRSHFTLEIMAKGYMELYEKPA